MKKEQLIKTIQDITECSTKNAKFCADAILLLEQEQKEVKSAEEILMKVCRYESPITENDLSDDITISEALEAIESYHAQFQSKPTDEQRQEITDEEIEKWADDLATNKDSYETTGKPHTGYNIAFAEGLKRGAKWMREQGKGIDLREELIKFLKWIEEATENRLDADWVDEYLKAMRDNKIGK